MSKKQRCEMEGCGNDMLYRRLGLCSACYQYLWVWKQRSVTEIIGHKRKLAVRSRRLDVVEPRVSVLRRKRK